MKKKIYRNAFYHPEVVSIGRKSLENLESSLECLFFFDHPKINEKKEFTPFLDFKIYISMLVLEI